MSEDSGTFFRFKIEVLLLSLSMPPSSALLCTWDTAVLRQHLLSVRLSHTLSTPVTCFTNRDVADTSVIFSNCSAG